MRRFSSLLADGTRESPSGVTSPDRRLLPDPGLALGLFPSGEGILGLLCIGGRGETMSFGGLWRARIWAAVTGTMGGLPPSTDILLDRLRSQRWRTMPEFVGATTLGRKHSSAPALIKLTTQGSFHPSHSTSGR